MRKCCHAELTPKIIVSFLLAIPGAHAEMRQFTDVDGRALQAEMVSAAEASIHVKLKSGQTATIEMARLSASDQAYVKEWLVAHKAGKSGAVIAEQNWGGKKTVRESDFDLKDLISGKIMVYRPSKRADSKIGIDTFLRAGRREQGAWSMETRAPLSSRFLSRRDGRW